MINRQKKFTQNYTQRKTMLYLCCMNETTTSTTKDIYIGCRIDERTRAKIEQAAQNNKRELSDYLRLLFDYAIEKKLKF